MRKDVKMYQVDTLLYNGKFFNSYTKKFVDGYAVIKDGRFYHVGKGTQDMDQFDCGKKVDCGGRYVAPGLMDIHMHIESSLTSPVCFTDYLVKYGVTTVVSEPHEIANVFGIKGILAMIEAAEGSPVDVYYGIPSSVPSTSEELETTGGAIEMEDLKELMNNPKIACLGEVMNTRGVLNEPDCKANQFTSYLREYAPNLPLEGHVPRIKGVDLSRYLYTGVDSDHTEHDLEEVIDRYEKGMFMEIQMKMLKPEVIDYIIANRMYEHTAFVTDDTMADTFAFDGHLNRVVAGAIELGMSPEEAIYCGTFTPARRMHFYDRGVIAPGKLADFVVLEDLEKFVPAQTYKNGIKVYDIKEEIVFRAPGNAFGEEFYHSVKLEPVSPEKFAIPATGDSVTVRVMRANPTSNQTSEEQITLPVKNGEIDWENREDIGLMVCIERYGKGGKMGVVFTTGAYHKRGAYASTYAHDHHNMLAGGHSKADIAAAINQVISMQGGMAVVEDGKVLAVQHLPIAGLLSDRPVPEIGQESREVRAALEQLGYEHYDPVMNFCTACLPVSPDIKLTDKGIIHVATGKILPLTV